VTEADHSAYHAASWLPGGLESFIADLEFPTIDNTIVVCFESQVRASPPEPQRHRYAQLFHHVV
jgi:hypothetical protein